MANQLGRGSRAPAATEPGLRAGSALVAWKSLRWDRPARRIRRRRTPDAVRAQLRRLKVPQLVATAAAFRPSADLSTPTAATKLALKSIANRYEHLSAEIDSLDGHLDHLVAAAAPALVAIKGVVPTSPPLSSPSLAITPSGWLAKPTWSGRR